MQLQNIRGVEQKHVGGDVWNCLSEKTLLSFFSFNIKALGAVSLVKGTLAPSENRGHCTHPHMHWTQISPDGHYLVLCLTVLAKLFIETVLRRPWGCFMGGSCCKISTKQLSMFPAVSEQSQDSGVFFFWSHSSGSGVYVCACLGPVYIFTHEWVCLCAYVCFSRIAVSVLVYLLSG